MELTKNETMTLLTQNWVVVERNDERYCITKDLKGNLGFIKVGHSEVFEMTTFLNCDAQWEHHNSHISTILANLGNEIGKGGTITQSDRKSALKLLNEIMEKLQ